MDAASIQQKYYESTAERYDAMHLEMGEDREHIVALHWLSAAIHQLGIRSVLDVGAGTGRTIEFLAKEHPGLRVAGVEPVEALRKKGYEKGIPPGALVAGDGNNLPFGDGEFDLVCEFAVLHHVPRPDLMVGEMLRVGKRAIFISDGNNFGQGSFVGRIFKQAINAFGLWPVFNYLRTGGKKYQISEGDGLYYSYSVFNNYPQIKRACPEVHLMNTRGTGGPDLYRTAGSIALLGVKNVE